MELICTIGPRVNNYDDIKSYIQCGMTIPRFNFSHVNYEKFATLLKDCTNIKYIMGDLQGNKLRVSKKFKGEVKVARGCKAIFCMEKDYEKLYYKNLHHIIIPICYKGSFNDFKKVHHIFMKDATMMFKVNRILDNFLSTITLNGGIIRAEKGINVPGLDRNTLRLTEKDKYDVEWGIKRGINIFSLSYAVSKDNVIELKDYIKDIKNNYGIKGKIKVYAKIECLDGFKNFEEILSVSDGIILGRGDLKGEIKVDETPYIQENIVKRMKKSRKNLFVATYLLDSMVRNREPIPGEINDIFNLCNNKVNGLILSTELTLSNRPEKIIRSLKKYTDNFLSKTHNL